MTNPSAREALRIALTETFAKRADADKVPAASVAVLADGELHEFAFGTGTESRFQACSISKPIAAAVALRLAAEGRLDLDEDVNTYLKSWRLPGLDGWDVRVTVRHLITHTSTLTTHGFPGYAEGEPQPTLTQILDGEAPANTLPVRVDGVPGLTFRYSGGGFQLLQLLLEDVTGRPYAELAHEYVLEPFGMATAGFEAVDAAPAHVGGEPVEGGWHRYPEQAAAGLWCRPADLVRFFAALAEAAEGAPDAVLPQALAAEALTEFVPGMGLGVQIDPDPLGDRFGHGGSNHGYECLAIASRTGGYAVAVMTNASEGQPVALELDVAVAETVGWPRTTGNDIHDDTDWKARWCGAYRTAAGLELRVEDDEDGQLSLFAPGQAPLALDASDASSANGPYAHVDLMFAEGEDGRDVLTLRQFGTSVSAVRETANG